MIGGFVESKWSYKLKDCSSCIHLEVCAYATILELILKAKPDFVYNAEIKSLWQRGLGKDCSFYEKAEKDAKR